ncbi:ciliogenesis-associated TTC17-interacting protein-like isoform X2 [Lasioglossum baleicum]|uniref:ciliogenesis-associated TTC17-interacting protein-like isoform X2 n=1 Tax=Lasioglossum baleicum TaxID=434251 RepID=UPI003FCEBD2E
MRLRSFLLGRRCAKNENWSLPVFTRVYSLVVTADNRKRAALCFRETLIVCSKSEFERDTKPIGGYCILVESVGPRTHEFLVQVQSSMSIDGHFGGTKIIGSATSKLHCLEEKRTEFEYTDDGLRERSIYIGIEDDSYYVKLTRTCPCDQLEETISLDFNQDDGLISETVNILLMRYLALINYEGTLSFQTIGIDGELTRSSYECTPAERIEIDGHFLNAYTTERKIYKQDGSVHIIKTDLSSQGRILRHNRLDVPYILKMNPLADPNIASSKIRLETPLQDRWSEDIEMFSKYLDTKFSKMAEHTEYLLNHPEVKHLITDYTETLLVVKPEDVIDFTIQHFKAFAKDPITWETSTEDETDDDVDVKSQLAEDVSEVVCGICGLSIKCPVPKETPSRSSDGECRDMRSYDSMELASPYEETNSGKQSTISEDDSKLEVACSKCHTIMKICDEYQPLSKCPGCFEITSACSKCSIIDQIIHMLKG